MWLRALRENARLTQDELAARLQLAGIEIGRQAISHWEVGRYAPPMNDRAFRAALAQALDISVTDLLMNAGYEYVTEFDEDAGRAAQIVQSMPPDRRAIAIKLLETLAAP